MLLTSKPVVIVGRRDGKKEERYAGEERIRQAAETHATSLDLSGLGLREVPEPLGQLTALQGLGLSGNQLRALPASLGQLTALWVLNLNDNQLRALPESLGQLSALRELYLHANPELGLPAEVLGPTWDEVRKKQKTLASPKSSWTTTSAAGRRDHLTRPS